MPKLSWQRKLAILKELAPISLEMRKPGDWFVNHSVECVENGRYGILVGRYGNGSTPAAAVEDHWQQLTDPNVNAIVVGAYTNRRREYCWNGYTFGRI